MGKGLYILLWDKWGSGLVKVNPRLATKGVDIYGNPKNWFPYQTEEEKNAIIEELTQGFMYFEVLD